MDALYIYHCCYALWDYMMRKGVKIGYVQAVKHNNITYLHFQTQSYSHDNDNFIAYSYIRKIRSNTSKIPNTWDEYT